MYDAERADVRALEQLEAVLRELGEELATWRARALKAESDTKGGGTGSRGGATPRGDAESRGRVAELEVENRHLKSRVDAARSRVQELVTRLAFLEEQSREAAGTNGGASGSVPR